jgi:hypothetical protein
LFSTGLDFAGVALVFFDGEPVLNVGEVTRRFAGTGLALSEGAVAVVGVGAEKTSSCLLLGADFNGGGAAFLVVMEGFTGSVLDLDLTGSSWNTELFLSPDAALPLIDDEADDLMEEGCSEVRAFLEAVDPMVFADLVESIWVDFVGAEEVAFVGESE